MPPSGSWARLLPSSRPRRVALAAAALALGSYAAYRLSRSETLALALRVREVARSYTEALAPGADLTGLLIADLQRYLASPPGTPLPASLRQLAAALSGPEAAQGAQRLAEAVLRGVSQATAPQVRSAVDSMDLSPARVGDVVQLATRMGALGLLQAWRQHSEEGEDGGENENERDEASSGPLLSRFQRPGALEALASGATDSALDFLASRRGQALAVAMVSACMSSAVGTYVDRTADVNVFEQLLSAARKPAHLEAVRVCVGTLAREGVRAAARAAGLGGGGQRLRLAEDSSGACSAGRAGRTPPPSRQDSLMEEAALRLALARRLGGSGEGGEVSGAKRGQSPSPSRLVGSSRDEGSRSAPPSPEGPSTPATPATPHRGEDAAAGEAAPRDASPPESLLAPGGCDAEAELLFPDAQSSRRRGADWGAALRKELVQWMRDPAGREVVTAVVGTAARESVQALAGSFDVRAVLVVGCAVGVLIAMVQLFFARLLGALF